MLNVSNPELTLAEVVAVLAAKVVPGEGLVAPGHHLIRAEPAAEHWLPQVSVDGVLVKVRASHRLCAQLALELRRLALSPERSIYIYSETKIKSNQPSDSNLFTVVSLGKK